MSDTRMNTVKMEIRSLLLSAPVGLTLRELERDYHLYIGNDLPYQEFGYSNPEEFLRDIPDTVEVTRRDNVLTLTGVCDPTTKHIQKLVSRQKLDTRKKWKALPPVSKNVARRNQSGIMENTSTNGNCWLGHQDQKSYTHDTSQSLRPHVEKLHPEFSSRNTRTIPQNIRRNILETVKIHTEGIPLTHFCAVFRKISGVTLNPQTFGFSNISDLLSSLGDLVVVKRLSGGEAFVLPAVPQRLADGHQYFHGNGQTERDISASHGQSQTDRAPALSKTSQWKDQPHAGLNDCTNQLPELDKNCDISLAVQEQIRNIMKEKSDGIFASCLSLEYKKMFNKQLPLKMYGYRSVIEFASNLPHIVKIQRPDPNGDWLLLPAGVPTSAEKSFEIGTKETSLKCSVSGVKVDDSTREAIVQVLGVHNNEIPLHHFENVFKEFIGQDLDFRKFGAGSLKQLLHFMPDIVFISLDASDKPIVCLKVSDRPRKFDKLKDEYQPTATHQPGQPLLHLPNDAVGPGCFYHQEHLPDFGQEAKYVDVYVSNIISPAVFWIQLRGRRTTLALEDLMDEADAFYTSSRLPEVYHMTPGLAQAGLVCAAIFPEDGHWYRAIITNIRDQLIEVFYVDYGNSCYVSITQMRLLKTKFIKLPAQAIQARLSNIKPNGGAWRINSRDRFLALTRDRPLVGLITSVKDGVVSLCLTDTSHDEDIHINDIFVDEGYAYFVPDNGCSSEVVTHAEAPSMDLLYGEARHATINNAVSVTSSDLPSRRYVRPVQMMDEITMNVVNLDGELYVLSSELSSLFFTEDILSAQLARDKVDFPKKVVTREDNSDLFEELAAYEVVGLTEFTDVLSLFLLSSLPSIVRLYDKQHKLADVIQTTWEVLQWFDPSDPYWKGEDEQSVSEHSEEAETWNSVCDSPDMPGIHELRVVLESLELQRKCILGRMMRDNQWTEEKVNELHGVENRMKMLEMAIVKLQKSQGQAKECKQQTSALQDGKTMDQTLRSNVHNTSQDGVISPTKSMQKVAPIVQVSPPKRKPLSTMVEESCQTGPDVNSFLQEQIMLNRLLMHRIGVSREALISQQLITQPPVRLSDISRQQQPIQQPSLQPQPPNRTTMAPHFPYIYMPYAQYQTSFPQNQWPMQGEGHPQQQQQCNNDQQLHQQQQLHQFHQMKNLQQMNHIPQVNDLNSRMAAWNMRAPPTGYLPNARLPSPGSVTPSCIGLIAGPPERLIMGSQNPNWHGVADCTTSNNLARDGYSGQGHAPSK